MTFKIENQRSFRLAMLTAATLLVATAGCGGPDADSDDPASDPDHTEGAATSTFIISCPNLSKASWIQAANGTVDLITGQTIAAGAAFGTPTTTLECSYTVAAANPQLLDHTVQFAPGTVPSACGAKATFSGSGQQVGGVPPFGGWQFKSSRVSAFTTYDMARGTCRLQMPVVSPSTTLKVKVT